MKYHGILMGGKIYSLRIAKGMTQEQLAAVLCISPAAVSKWERNLAYPNVEMLCTLADLFDCTIDELVGRNVRRLEQLGEYENERLRLVEIAEECLKCAEIARREGLLALEKEMEVYSGSKFFNFAVKFFLQGFSKGMNPEIVFGLLENYVETLPKEERSEGELIKEGLQVIAAGESPELIKEVVASHIGPGYWEKLERMKNTDEEINREKMIAKYAGKKPYSHATELLEELTEADDFEIQVILRNMDNQTLVAAMCGAGGRVIIRFLSNLADRLMFFVVEDIDSWEGSEEEIVKAQRRVLEIKASCFPEKL